MLRLQTSQRLCAQAQKLHGRVMEEDPRAHGARVCRRGRGLLPRAHDDLRKVGGGVPRSLPGCLVRALDEREAEQVHREHALVDESLERREHLRERDAFEGLAQGIRSERTLGLCYEREDAPPNVADITHGPFLSPCPNLNRAVLG